MSRPYKLWLLASLYLAQGLPYGFFTQALPVLLREQGFSLKAISLTSLLFVPWALKFLWAPLVDQYGERRQWLLALQCAAVVCALLLTGLEISDSLLILFAAVFLFNLIAATQDIATDGLAVNLLTAQERGLGNGIQVGAYRIGMIMGGGLLLWIFSRQGWQIMFLCMAGLLLLTVLPVLGLRKSPTRPARAKQRATGTNWMRRTNQPGMLIFIVLICLYKFGDSMGASLLGPFMKDNGFSTEEIALLKGTMGSVSALIGASLGAWMAFRLGRRTALLCGGLLQTTSLMFYALAATGIYAQEMIWAGCIAEHLLGGIAVVALFTLMMDASEPAHASTDYTLLACAINAGQGLASFAGASIADAAGYLPMFMTSVVLSGIGCLVLVVLLDRGHGPARLQTIWHGKIGA